MYPKETENSDLKKARQSLIEELEAVNLYEIVRDSDKVLTF